jgi:hypothetical protein
MKTRLTLTIAIVACIAAMLALLAQTKGSRSTSSLPAVEASYGYSNEMTYRSIVVKRGKLRYTYNARNSLRDPKRIIIAQRPHYTKNDMVTVEASLSSDELLSLANMIRGSGFLKLKPVYDERPGYRFYPVDVSASVGGKVQSVQVRNGAAPGTFKQVANALTVLTRKRFPLAPAPNG